MEGSLRILAPVPDAFTCLDCLRAVHAAARIEPGADITALRVRVDPTRLVISDEEFVLQRWRMTREGACQERRDATHRVFANG